MTEQEILQRVHEIELELMQEVVRVCEKYNLTYYLMYGSLIGAVRHQGFIPWDDDIDVSMPRKDYEIFREVCKKEISGDFFFQDYATDKHYTDGNLHIRKIGTKYINRKTENLRYKCDGVWLDIFPLDNVDKSEFKGGKFRFKLTQKLTKAALARSYTSLNGLTFKNKLMHFILLPFTVNFLVSIREKVSTMNKNDNSDYMAYFCSPYGFEREVIRREDYGTPSKVKFEGRVYSAPENTDAVLSHIYGSDYMTPPAKEEQRIFHRPYIVEL